MDGSSGESGRGGTIVRSSRATHDRNVMKINFLVVKRDEGQFLIITGRISDWLQHLRGKLSGGNVSSLSSTTLTFVSS